MAEFTSSDLPVAGGDPNQFLISQRNSLASLSADQDLQDRATFRNNAAGLVARDPGATAAALGSNPTATQGYLNALPGADTDTRQQAAVDQDANSALAAATLNAPPDQRATVYAMGRDMLAQSGHKTLLPADYPGDGNLQAARALGLSTADQLKLTPQPLSANPVPLLQSTPGGGYVGPGGAVQSAGSAGITAAPLAAPNGTGQPSASGGAQAYNAALGQAESSNRPGIVNGAGYAGQFQFGGARLADLGMYQPAAGESANSNRWQGQFSIPGFPQVKTVSDFLASPAAQAVAQNASVANIDQAIDATPGAQKFDRDGLRAVAHLGGVGGMQQFIATGGRYNPADSNSTSLGNYYRRFSGVSGQQPARVQLASAANSTGMAPVANDASPSQPSPPGTASPPPGAVSLGADPNQPPPPRLPVPPGGGYAPPTPTPDSPHDTPDASNAVAVDSVAAGAGLPFGTRVRLPDGSVQFTGNGLVPASATPQAAHGPAGGPGSANGRIPLSRADERFGPAPVQQNALLGLVAPALLQPAAAAQPSQGAGAASAASLNLLLGATAQQAPSPAASAPTPPTPNGLFPATQLGNPAALPAPQAQAGGQPSAAPASTAADRAVQQAAAELAGSIRGMSPEAQNAAIVQRAQQIVAQGQPLQAARPAASQSPAAPSYPFARDRMTGAYVPVPEQPGFAYAIGPGGQPVAQMIPGAPGAGVETKVTPTGDVVTSNKSTGQYNVDRGVLPNTARIGQVNDGSAVHVFQPGSGEIGSFPLQANTSKIQTDMYAEDRKSQAQQIDVAQQSQQQQVRLLEARQAMQGLPTGSGGEARAAWSNWAETYLPPAWATQMKAKLNLPDAVPAQEFAKLMTQSAGQQERAVAGARGGIGMMTLFKNNNPGLEMQPGANQDLLNAQLVATQADADYAKGYVNFVNDQGQKLVSRQGYTPASQFDQSWLQQRNPQVYTAAAEAMSGKPFAFWSKGLSPAEGRRALQIVGGIDPTLIAQGSAGPLPVRQFMGAQ